LNGDCTGDVDDGNNLIVAAVAAVFESRAQSKS